ncbi:uncharacterized protein LOC130387318 [Gadus chalcogrammus]|uniref:uncharacterized protein LOC130387318 n=1 Tax=Gadus chalcogrammus TaxID=1042646 RepID=UPI0024C476CB|nr:uncharacterized protein LOC130387318 [Gadus chalcogrammus]
MLKFADDTTLIGLISGDDDSAYRNEILSLTEWCSHHNLEVDFRRQRKETQPLSINAAVVERVDSFKFLGTIISSSLKWVDNITTIIKKAHQRLFFLRQLRKFGVACKGMQQFYQATVESILTFSITVWDGNPTVQQRMRLDRIVHTASKIPVEVELMEETDSAVVAMAAELQDQVSVTRIEREGVSFRCNSDQCVNYIYWYQKKETKTFTVILRIDKSNGNIYKEYNHPQKDDFSSVLKENSCELSLQAVKASHSATYYCSCWTSGYFTVDILTFGRGTTLVVTDSSVERPKVSVYPATGADLKGRRSLLCVARDMFPEEVQFSWRRRGGGGGGGKDGEQLEPRGPTYPASILVIDQGETLMDPYICSVQHESGLQEVEFPDITLTSEGHGMTEMTLTSEGPGKTDVTLATAVTTDPRRPGRPREGPSDETHQSLQVLSRARLASVLYTVMVVKSVLCCCGLALLLLHTNKTSRTPRTSTTTALD